MGLFKKSGIKDERITNTKNKIYAEIHILVMVIAVVSIVFKYFIYNRGIESVTTELLILFLSAVYFMYRSTSLGVFSAEIEMHDRESKWPQQKKNLVASITLGVVIALVFGTNSAVQYADGLLQSIYYFFLTALVSLMIYLPFFLIFIVGGNEILKRNSEKSIDRMLHDESGDNDEKH
ncbi:DUF6773 family protein [Planococcus citreus]|uniref:Uncharacterized protein n=1 Tax=Planococcus citreus TaxID=1373 RepID=A0A497YPQ1_9BACL|nr:DUF6773 family protein [Planococcus citreus]RLJ86631.1 hypothetical protein DFR62_2234 [Planococcus citreus]